MTSIAPWLSVNDATRALAFYQAAFGAVKLERLEDDGGHVVVAQLSIEGPDFWIQSDAASSPQALNRMSVRMILTVDDQTRCSDGQCPLELSRSQQSPKSTGGASAG